MKYNIKKIFIFSLFFSSILFMNAGFVSALEAQYPTIFGIGIGNGTLPEYARYFFNIGMALAGILAVGVIAFGGIYFLVDFARGKFADEGKEWIKAGVIGLLIVVSAYLIVYTINPALVVFDLKGLAPLNFLSNIFKPPAPPGPPVEVYNEIPIGTLTENLLARENDCYNFDGNGDPILGEQITTDDNQNILGPTYLNHDRVDCFAKLGQATADKAKVIKNLSDKIAALMKQCSCSGKCDSVCDADKDCNQIKIPSKDANGNCPSPCANGLCKPPKIFDKTYQDPDNLNRQTCCSTEIKRQIEHGIINIADCNGQQKGFRGLDEFRSQYNNDYNQIKNKAEVHPSPKIKGKEITIINKDEWQNLRLVDQLIYLQGKMTEVKQKVQQDLDELKKGEASLGQCYLADTYVDFLKTNEQTNKKDKLILTNRTFSDPEINQLVSPAKYCQGFQYNNSSCYSQCQKVCPGTAETDLNCYKNQPNCNNITDFANKQQCLAEQAIKVKECFDNRVCIPGASPFRTFKQCMTGCKQQCLDSCSQKCGGDLTKCVAACNGDSQCLINNEDKCLVDFNQLKKCADAGGGTDIFKNCADNSATLCKYCSDQYANYPDCNSCSSCNTNPYSNSCLNCREKYPETVKCKFASKCPLCPCDIAGEPAIPPATSLPNQNGTSCTSGNNTGGSGSGSGGGPCNGQPMKDCGNGITSCDCPTTSGTGGGGTGCACPGGTPGTPSCYPPCGGGSGGGGGITGGGGNGGGGGITGGGGNGGGSGGNNKYEYNVCNGACDASAYNDDPLTFYCQQSWWLKDETKNTTSLGGDMICQKDGEIPVGQTIDESEKWAQNFLDTIDKVAQKVNGLTQYLQRIAQKTNYCNCDSKCEDNKPTCHTDCKYNKPQTATTTDPDTGKKTTATIPASCSFVPCNGSPCQVMIDLLLGANCNNACAAGNGIAYYYDQINTGIKDFSGFTANLTRSDIVKKLSYSRQKTNQCSTVQNNYGTANRILSCTRVEDEIISPIIGSSNPIAAIINGKATNSYCYGKALGAILQTPDPLADNWFCCQQRQKGAAQETR